MAVEHRARALGVLKAVVKGFGREGDWPKEQSLNFCLEDKPDMKYRCEATSVAGFVQQLAVGYLARGYVFYVVGEVPTGKDPRLIDEKLIQKYEISASKATRSRRKALGLANVQYLRFKDRFVLLATHGEHDFFVHEAGQIKDAREMPIKVFGYALSYRAGHPHVRIEQGRYLELKAYLTDLAVHRKKDWLEGQFRSLWYEPYAPVRSQLHCLLRRVNSRRKLAQFELLAPSCIRTRRRIVSPFGSCMPLERRTSAFIEAEPSADMDSSVGDRDGVTIRQRV